jgi:hypothetical protein
MPDPTTTGRELDRLPAVPQTEHAPFVVLWADEVKVYEVALAFASGYAHIGAPGHARAFGVLAEELHRRLLGDGPGLDADLFHRVLAQGAGDPPPPAPPGDVEAMAPTTLAAVEPDPTLAEDAFFAPTVVVGSAPAQKRTVADRLGAWLRGGSW